MNLPASALLQIGTVTANIGAFKERKRAALVALCHRYSQDGAAYAKPNAPWQDKTGNARSLLHGKVVQYNTSIRARISHGVYYGIFLEKKHSGRYAVLPKVLRRFETEFLEDVQRVAKGGISG